MCFGAQKNRLSETVFWVPTTYALVEKIDFFLIMHSYQKAWCTQSSFRVVNRVGMILPARVNPPHKTRVYPGWAIRSYYPLWAICGFYEFLVLQILGFQCDNRYKSVEMILYSHIVISLNGNSEIVIKIWVSTLTFKNILHVFFKIQKVSFQLYLIIIILSIIMIMLVF